MALEMRFVLALARMELHGVMVNESAIRDIVKTHLDEIKEAEEKLGFNPASNPSCLAFVKKIIGPEMESASKEALANYYHIPQIEVLGRAKQAKARAGLLVKMYEHKADGRIHPQFTQILATGRLACKNPNMQQVPRTVKDYIYRAPAGRVVFSADYPAIELRLCSVWHEEPIMIEAFQKGEDLHYKMAAMMTGKKIPVTDEEKHDESGIFINKEERTAAKNCFIKGTEILTDAGWIKIEDLCDWVDSDGTIPYLENRYKAIDPFTSEPIDILFTHKEVAKEILEFNLEDGSTMSVTPEHRMWVRRNGTEKIVLAKDVVLSDEIIPYENSSKKETIYDGNLLERTGDQSK